MPSRKPTARGKRRPAKRLLDEVAPNKSSTEPKVVVIDLVTDYSQCQSPNAPVSTSSSILKRHEEVKKGLATLSPDPTLPSAQSAASQRQQLESQQLQKVHMPISAALAPTATVNSPFFYSPVYRRYFSLTPPNPRLYNPQLLKDYIDWYINVYLEEELRWHSINIGSVAERVKRSEEETEEEAKRLASTTSTPKDKA